MDTDQIYPPVVENHEPVAASIPVVINLDDKKGTLSKVWTDGVFIMLMTAAAYAGCYYFEVGFTSYYNIPQDFIVVSLQNLLLCFGSIFSFVILVMQFWALISHVGALDPIRASNNLLIILIKKYQLSLIISALIMLASHFAFYSFVILASLVVMPFLIEVSVPVLLLLGKRHRRVNEIDSLSGCIKHVRQWMKQPLPANHISVPTAMMHSFSYAVPLLFSIWLCSVLGQTIASIRTTFPFIGDSNEAILRRYGDAFVVGQFDPDSGQLLSEFRLVKADELKERIVMRNIGTVSPATLQRHDVRRFKKPAGEPKPALPKKP
jgi:hypothetical protein